MAVLTNEQRAQTARAWIRRTFEELNQTANLSTEDVRAALDAADNWVEANQNNYNTALPQPFRNAATLPQKALLLAFVAMKRGGII